MRTSPVLILLCLCLCLPLAVSGEESGLAIQAPERVRAYAENALTVSAPAEGRLTVTWAQDGLTGTIAENMSVTVGTHAIPWDALGAHGEPLTAGTVALTASLNGQQAVTEARVGTPAAAVQFAVASHDTLHPGNSEEYHIYYQLSNAGTLRVALLDDAGSTLRTWNLKRNDTQARTFRFDGTVGGKTLPAGQYSFTFQVGEDLPPIVVPLELSDAIVPALPVTATVPSDYLPASDDDADVWAALIAPITVVDIGALSHQAIKDAQGQTVGQVHGQSAGVMVHEVTLDGMARVSAWRTEDGARVEGYVPVSKLKVITPNPRYGVVIDKRAQTLTVYESGSRLGSMPISTGLPTANKLFRETAAGAFLTEKRIASFTSEGYRYDYPIRIDGGNLIHQLGWNRASGFADQEPQLGTKASHGCVRMQRGHGDAQISAYWLWANLPTGTKVLVLDDPNERAAYWPTMFPGQTAPDAIPAPTQAPELAAVASATLEPAPSGEVRTVVMTFGGDSVLGSEESKRRRAESFDSYISERGHGWPFEKLQPIFANDDWTVINLEGVLKDDSGNKQDRLYNFRGPTDFAAILPASSVEMVNIANNHHVDYGKVGRRTTREALDAAGIAYAGYGDLYVWEKDGIKIGFGGIRETTWRQDRQQMANDIALLKAQGCGLIIYSCHFGKEYDPNHNALQTEIAYMAIDEGADIIIGHHPHVVQGVEHYNGGVIFYSLGNLVFGGNLKLTEFDGLLVQAAFTFTGNTCTHTEFSLIPVLTSGAAPANDFRPLPAVGEDRERVLAKVQQDSLLPLMGGVLAFSRTADAGYVLHEPDLTAFQVEAE